MAVFAAIMSWITRVPFIQVRAERHDNHVPSGSSYTVTLRRGLHRDGPAAEALFGCGVIFPKLCDWFRQHLVLLGIKLFCSAPAQMHHRFAKMVVGRARALGGFLPCIYIP